MGVMTVAQVRMLFQRSRGVPHLWLMHKSPFD